MKNKLEEQFDSSPVTSTLGAVIILLLLLTFIVYPVFLVIPGASLTLLSGFKIINFIIQHID